MATLNRPPRYAKGISKAYVFDRQTGNVLATTNKFNNGSIDISENEGAIETGLNNGLAINLPDTRRMTGSFEAADYSLEIRAMQLGSSVSYNATTLVREKIVATSTTLTVTRNPVNAYEQSVNDSTYNCYVGNDGVNYGVNPQTKEVQDFTAVVGQEYCVMYYAKMISAEVMPIPTAGSPLIASMVIVTPMYGENGATANNSTHVANHYYFIPKAQFIGGNPGYSGSQTEASTTSWNFTALSDDEGEICSDCEGVGSVYGYEVIVPCNNDELSAVTGIAVVGGVMALAVNDTRQTPVFYVMENGSLVTPPYEDFNYVSATPTTATVNETGMITAVAEGTTNITVTSKLKPTLKEASISVTVTA